MTFAPSPSSETSALWRRAAHLSEALLDASDEEIQERLRELKGSEGQEIAATVQRLLQADRASGSFLDKPLADLASGELGAPKAGQRIGPYEIVGALGQGGMGTVYEARRREPYETQVAIKLGPAMAAGAREDLVLRFERERQILGRLGHPGIARILDGGSWETRPYLVMEKVDGRAIDLHCREVGLDLEQRVALLIDLCEAIDHAHRHLVVHRDLKPSNVLVGPTGRPVILDFGVAQLLEGDRTFAESEATLGPSYLTPSYASPEQMRGEPVSTACDVYSLGVLLYELISGRRPRQFVSLRPALIEAGLREAPPSLRGVRPVALGRRADRDLDAILQRCLAVDAIGRYPSASALANDLRRWLDRFPVLAFPTPWSRRLGSLVRRQWKHLSVALLLTSLGATLVLRHWSARRDLRAEQRAAARNLAALHTVIDSLDASRQSDRPEALASALSSLDVGRSSAVRSDRALGEILTSMARLRMQSADYESAELLLERVATLWASQGDAMRHGTALVEIGRLALARGLFGDAVEILSQARELANVSESAEVRLAAGAALLDAHRALRQMDRASALARELSVEVETATAGTTTAAVHSALGYLARAAGHLQKAESRFRRALEDTSAEHAWEAEAALASILIDHRGPADEAYALLLSLESALPPESKGSLPGLEVAMLRAQWEIAAERFDDAEATLRALDCRPALGPMVDGNCRLLLARAAIGAQRPEAARAELDILKGYTATLPEGHPWQALVLYEEGRAQEATARVDEARELYQEAISIWDAAHSGGLPEVARAELDFARLIARTGARERADDLRRHATEILLRELHPDHPFMLQLETEHLGRDI